MGMDNTLYKVKKDDYKKEDDLFKLVYYNYNESTIIEMRKNYILNETVENVLNISISGDLEIITKNQLIDIIKVLQLKRQQTTDMRQLNDIYEALGVLITINKLFDFDNYILVYECVD